MHQETSPLLTQGDISTAMLPVKPATACILQAHLRLFICLPLCCNLPLAATKSRTTPFVIIAEPCDSLKEDPLLTEAFMTHVLAEFSTPLVGLAKQENRVSEKLCTFLVLMYVQQSNELALCLSAPAHWGQQWGAYSRFQLRVVQRRHTNHNSRAVQSCVCVYVCACVSEAPRSLITNLLVHADDPCI